jgi:glycosyltransferase involved in cell wall biosynthesis
VKSISVIVPAHNAAASILEALRSLISEADLIHEILVIDDASTDDTGLLAQRAGSTMSLPIRVIRAEHRDAGAARNVGLAEASAPWVYLLDADDQHNERGLRRLAERSREVPEAGLIAGGYVRLTDRTSERTKLPGPFGLSRAANAERYLAGRVSSMAIGSVLVARAAIGNTRFRANLPYDEDTLFLAEMLNSTTVATIHDTVLTYAVSTQRSDDRFVTAPARSFLTWRRALRDLERRGISRRSLQAREGIVAMKVARVHYARGEFGWAVRFLAIARAAPKVSLADHWRLARYNAKISIRRKFASPTGPLSGPDVHAPRQSSRAADR